VEAAGEEGPCEKNLGREEQQLKCSTVTGERTETALLGRDKRQHEEFS